MPKACVKRGRFSPGRAKPRVVVMNPDDIDDSKSYCIPAVEKECPDRDWCSKRFFKGLIKNKYCFRLKRFAR